MESSRSLSGSMFNEYKILSRNFLNSEPNIFSYIYEKTMIFEGHSNKIIQLRQRFVSFSTIHKHIDYFFGKTFDCLCWNLSQQNAYCSSRKMEIFRVFDGGSGGHTMKGKENNKKVNTSNTISLILWHFNGNTCLTVTQLFCSNAFPCYFSGKLTRNRTFHWHFIDKIHYYSFHREACECECESI